MEYVLYIVYLVFVNPVSSIFFDASDMESQLVIRVSKREDIKEKKEKRGKTHLRNGPKKLMCGVFVWD